MSRRNNQREGEPKRGKIITPEEQAAKDIQRQKNLNKRQQARHRDEIKENFGFDDTPVESLCERCGEMTIDVYPFRVEMPELKQRITGYPVMRICEGCYGLYEKEGARLVTMPTDDDLARRGPEQVYDKNKSRVKMF